MYVQHTVNRHMKLNSSPDAEDLLDGLRKDLLALPIYSRPHWNTFVRTQDDPGFDAMANLYAAGSDDPQRWGIAIKTRVLEPRDADLLGARLSEIKADRHLDGMMVLAPFVSEAAAEILWEREIGYWDASGNCRISSGALYIERKGFPNRFVRQASLGSAFTRMGQRILRPLLDPEHIGRTWTLRELAKAAYPGVSLGQVHALAKVLEGQNHLSRTSEGIQLLHPEKLLRSWARETKPPRLTQGRFYSSMPQDAFRKRFGEVVHDLGLGGKALLASFTAASELDPFVRQHRSFLYWTKDHESLQKALELETVPDGDNVVASVAPDEGVFYGWEAAQPSVTCPVQTFLDLMQAGGRGEDAAEHLFDRILKPRYTA